MEDRIAEYFTGIEAEKRKAICSLMDEWRTAVYERGRMYHESPCTLPGFVGCIAPRGACVGSYAN
jgi:hypothetical protein